MGCGASKSQQPAKPVFRILILGSAGVGKSSTGNSILEDEAFPIVSGMTPVTNKCSFGKADTPDREIQVVDMPSKFDSRDVLFKEIGRCMFITSPGPHVVLYLIRYDQRFTEEHYKEYQMLTDIFTDKIKQFMIVVFTGDIPPDPEEDVENQKQRNKFLSEILVDVSDRYVFLDNKKDNKEKRVRQLLTKAIELSRKSKNKYFSNDVSKKINSLIEDEAKKRAKGKHVSLEVAKADVKERAFENTTFYDSYYGTFVQEFMQYEMIAEVGEKKRQPIASPTYEESKMKSSHYRGLEKN